MQSREITKRDCVWDVHRILRRIMSDRSGRYSSEEWKEPHLVGMGEVLVAAFRHIRTSLVNGNGVHVRGFGTFTFKKSSNPDGRPRTRGGDTAGDRYTQQQQQQQQQPVIAPLFKVDEALAKLCKIKERGDVPRIPRFSSSIYETVPSAMYLNPVTVASHCGRNPSFVRAVLRDFFICLADLIRMSVPQLIRLDFHFGVFHFDTETRFASFKFNAALIHAMRALVASAREVNRHTTAYAHYVQLHPEAGIMTARRLRTPDAPRMTPVDRRLSTTMLGTSMTGLRDTRWERSTQTKAATSRNDAAGLPTLRSRSVRSAGVSRSGAGAETARSFASRVQHIQRMKHARPTTAA